MNRALRLSVIAISLVTLGPVSACLNDRDSLYRESMGKREVLKTVVGWFPVHSPLYYRMRIDCLRPAINAHTGKLDLYDDVAVAYDRLDDDGEAIRVIELKRAYMEAHGIKPHKLIEHPETYPDHEKIVASSKDPWYRYYANAGTFWAHRWFKSGMPKEHKKEWLDRAQAYIDKAIELNPYAHGLREWAQSETIRWVRTGKPGQTLADFLEDSMYNNPGSEEALAGLIELGGAWESVDVYHALAMQHADVYHASLGYFIFQRVLELQKAGHRSLTGKVFTPYTGLVQDPENTERDYSDLREAAEQYRKDLVDYETAQLRDGKHPDTNPDFWSGYKEPAFPSYGYKPGAWMNNILPLVILAIIVGLPVIGLILIIRGVAKAFRRRAF